MNEELQEKIGKLPKWAQQYVDKLQKDIAWYKAQLDKVEADDTSIRWDLYTENANGGIPDRARVLFDVADGTLECTLRDGSLYIRGYNVERPIVRPECAGIRVNAEK